MCVFGEEDHGGAFPLGRDDTRLGDVVVDLEEDVAHVVGDGAEVEVGCAGGAWGFGLDRPADGLIPIFNLPKETSDQGGVGELWG